MQDCIVENLRYFAEGVACVMDNFEFGFGLRSDFDFGMALEEFLDCFGGGGSVLSGHDGDVLKCVMRSWGFNMIVSVGLIPYVEGKTLFIIHC